LPLDEQAEYLFGNVDAAIDAFEISEYFDEEYYED